MSDFETSWARHADSVAEANALNKDVVFNALSAAGITHVLVEFDGCGDSGQIESAFARVHDTPIDFPAVTVSLHCASWNQPELGTRETSLAEAVNDLCYGCLEQTHAGWENNDGAYGELTFYIVERKITLNFNGRFTDIWSDAHTF